jgi:hypothetical protein
MTIGKLIFEASKMLNVSQNIKEDQIDFLVSYIRDEYPAYTLTEVAFVLRKGVTAAYGAIDFKIDVSTISQWFKKYQSQKDEYYDNKRKKAESAAVQLSYL